MQNVGFAQPDAAVDKKRVIGAGRILSDGHAGGLCQAVCRTHHEVIEAITRIEMRVESIGLCYFHPFGSPNTFFFNHRSRRRPDFEFNIHLARHHTREFVGNDALQAAFEPITSVGIAGTKGKSCRLILVGDQLGVSHPGIEGRLREVHLQLSDCCLPRLVSIHWAFSLPVFSGVFVIYRRLTERSDIL